MGRVNSASSLQYVMLPVATLPALFYREKNDWQLRRPQPLDFASNTILRLEIVVDATRMPKALYHCLRQRAQSRLVVPCGQNLKNSKHGLHESVFRSRLNLKTLSGRTASHCSNCLQVNTPLVQDPAIIVRKNACHSCCQ